MSEKKAEVVELVAPNGSVVWVRSEKVDVMVRHGYQKPKTTAKK